MTQAVLFFWTVISLFVKLPVGLFTPLLWPIRTVFSSADMGKNTHLVLQIQKHSVLSNKLKSDRIVIVIQATRQAIVQIVEILV